MAAVEAIGATASCAQGPRGRARDAQAPAAPSGSRALVPVAAPSPGARPALNLKRPFAPFLAQLIATQTHAPQTRARRRAEPEEALAAYAAAPVRAPRPVFNGRA